MRKAVSLLWLMCFAGVCFAAPKDSTHHKIHLHLLGSFYPILNWSNSIDTNGNFFNSPSRFEGQASYKKHAAGLGFSFEQSRSKGTIAGTPRESKKTSYSLSPFYMYKMAATKRWTVYLGAGCIIKKRSNEYVIATPLEIITDTWTTTTVAPMLLSRCNYKLNKHISLELEMNTYWARLIHERELVYPLTPSLGGHRITNTYDYSYSLPANLWFKYSL